MKTHLYLIIGDPFLRAQKSKSLAVEIEKKAGSPVTRQNFHLEETPIGTILSAARTLPFFSPAQVLCVQGADFLKEQDLAVLAVYLENPGPATTLILEADEIKPASELMKLVRTQGQVITFAKEDARNAGAGFIQQKLGQFRKTITSGAKARLLEMCGDAVAFLDTMLDRMIQFSGNKTEINEEMVAQFEENWTEMDVFKLTNAFLARDRERILKVFRGLIDFYEADLVALVGILHWQLRQLWQGAVLLEQGVSERDVCSRCKMQPGRLMTLKKFPVGALEAAMEALYQIDKKAKTGQIDGVAGLEAWLAEYAA